MEHHLLRLMIKNKHPILTKKWMMMKFKHHLPQLMEFKHPLLQLFDLNGPDVDEFDLNGVNVGVDKGGGDSQELSDSDDSDFLIDEDKIIDEPEVDMKEYFLHIDKDLEWIGNHS
ncbi:unnamed protein product [Lactuca saligna]|uniref:Uncharacterized protein n=1 Tax=Lactuca saligna TaxID=75948 RepID=A0AA36EDY1_LACSI|nr:unnamed protein product [Lactuca saligna]